MAWRPSSDGWIDKERSGLLRFCGDCVSLARSSADMLKPNCKKVSRANLKEGDLVFFRTGKGRKKVPNHVGIYLKNGKFIHTSTSNGVIVSSLSEPYYVRTWLTGGRVKNL